MVWNLWTLVSVLQVAERNPYIVKLANHEESIHKRELDYANIRIHPVITSRANEFIEGDNNPLSRAIRTLQSLLLIRPVQGNLTIPPKCTEYTAGLNEGKCVSPLPPQSDYKCGRYGIIPPAYIGTREVCNSSNSSCTMEGPDGPGLPNADYLLFVSVASTCKILMFVIINSYTSKYVYVHISKCKYLHMYAYNVWILCAH